MFSTRTTRAVCGFAVTLLAAGSSWGQASSGGRIELSDLTSMDFSSLSEHGKQELTTALNEDFCYCGCPHSLAQCLASHGSCPHAKRAAQLAAQMAAKQMSGEEIAVTLDKYYGSFDKRHPVKVDAKLCQGPADAQVTVVEYSDFECPYCGVARPMLEAFAKRNAKQVRLCYAPFPLTMHPNSGPAAAAALFARDHGKFWAMHDALFENQSQLTPAFIVELGAKVGLSPSELKAALSSNRYQRELDEWKESGRAANVEATPSIYFNGRKLELPLSADSFQRSMDDELEWMTHHNAWASD